MASPCGPMHSPFHLYEFGLRSFEFHGARAGYQIVHYEYYVAQTYMPKVLDPLLRRVMEMTRTGMQLEIWLQRKSNIQENRAKISGGAN